jgi:MFS family permease
LLNRCVPRRGVVFHFHHLLRYIVMTATPDTLVQMPDRHDSPAPARRVGPVPLWRNRDYLLLFGGGIISSMGTRVSQLAFPLLVLAITRSPLETGLISALRAVPYLIFALPVGALVDRWNRKRVMWLSDAGRAVAIGSIPIAFALGRLSIFQLGLVSCIEGTLFVFYNMAETASVPHVVAPEQIGRATAQGQLLDNTSGMLGPSLGGVIYSFGAAVPFVADAVSYLASVISLRWIRTEFQEERDPAPLHLWASIGEGIGWLWRQPVMRFIAFLTGGLMAFSMGYTLIVIVIAKDLHASNAAIGILFGVGGLGGILGALLADFVNKRFRFGQIMVVTTWLWGLEWLLYLFANNIWLLGLANFLGFVIVPVYMVAQFSYRLAMIPDHLQGRVNSVFRLIAFGAEPLSIALAGALLQWLGPVQTVLVITLPQLALAVVATLYRPLWRAAQPSA